MSLSKTARQSSPPNLMDMPILVIRKILEDVDFFSMLNLRKVCEAFQYYIDKNYMDFDLDYIEIMVKNKRVQLDLTNFEPKNVRDLHTSVYKIVFETTDNGGCCVDIRHQSGSIEKFHVKNSFLEEFAICLEGILKNLKSPLKSFRCFSLVEYRKPTIFQSIFGCCRSRNMKARHSDKLDFKAAAKAQNLVIEKVEKILKSKNHRVQTKILSISCFEPENLSRIASNIDKKALERLKIYRMQSEEEERQKVDLDGILDFRSFSNLKQLYVRNMIVSSSFLSFSHIPNCDFCFLRFASEREIVEKEWGNLKSADVYDQQPIPWDNIAFNVRYDV